MPGQSKIKLRAFPILYQANLDIDLAWTCWKSPTANMMCVPGAKPVFPGTLEA